MNATVKYFIKMLKDFNSESYLVVKNFMISRDGRKIWHPDDMRKGTQYKKVCIIGVEFSGYINMSNDCNADPCNKMPRMRSFPFEYNWNEWGSFFIDFDMIEDGLITKLLESVFMQILLKVDEGHDVFISNDLIMKRNSSYEHLTNIDMLDAVE